MRVIEVLHSYMVYLTKWNQTASLTSMISSVEKDLDYWEMHKEELTSIIYYEYVDTKEMTDDYIMSLEELLAEITRNNRDEKIKELLTIHQ